MPVSLTRTKKGRLLAFPVKKGLPNGVSQLEGRPDSKRHRRAVEIKEWNTRNAARIKELEEKNAKRGRE